MVDCQIYFKESSEARSYAEISEEDENIVINTKRSMLFNGGVPWTKKGESNFDVAQGSYDGAECAELVGLFLLNQVSKIKEIEAGLYRDDGLAATCASARVTENLKKRIAAIFKSYGLGTTLEANLKIVDFLDVIFNLEDGSFKPYTKPNSTPLYVHSQSNHPPSILKNIPINVNKRLSSISSDENMFNSAAPLYQEALVKSGYSYELKFDPTAGQSENKKKRNRKRKIIWFNPPFNHDVKTNVGYEFLKIVKECFPPGHKIHKILNKNTIKISYSTMPNMDQIMSSHNNIVLKNRKQEEKACNCKRTECPFQNKCILPGVVYQATVSHPSIETKNYVGMTAPNFKTRLAIHNHSFKVKEDNQTALSRYIWKLKEEDGITPNISWTFLERGKKYSPVRDVCSLCDKEKFYILFRPDIAQLNKRNELWTTCRHKKLALLIKPKKRLKSHGT